MVGGEVLRHVGPDDVLGELQPHVLGQAGVGGGGGGSGGVGQGGHLTGLGGNRGSHGLLGLRGTLFTGGDPVRELGLPWPSGPPSYLPGRGRETF